MNVLKKNYNIFRAILIDFSLNIYFIACLQFFYSHFLEKEFLQISFFYNLFFAIILTFFVYLSGNSLGQFSLNISKKHKKFQNLWKLQIIVSLITTFAVGWILVEIQPIKFFTKFRNSRRIVSGLFNPNFKLFIPVLSAMIETIYLALLATVFAIPCSFILSFFAARNLMPRTVLGNTGYVIVRTLATLIRSIEAIVWAIVFSVWVGIGPFAGMLALMFHSMASLTKLYSEQIENIEKGQIEAIKSTGANTFQIWYYAVIPQILSPFLAFTIYRWDINLRMATIVGFVGGGGIGLALQQQQQLLQWKNVGLIMWMIAFVVWIMDMVSGKVREKLLDN